MQDDVERVAAAVQQAFYEGGGYEGMARAAMAATLELAVGAIDQKDWGTLDDNGTAALVADWLQQCADKVRAIGAP